MDIVELAGALTPRKDPKPPLPFPRIAWMVQHPDGTAEINKGLADYLQSWGWEYVSLGTYDMGRAGSSFDSEGRIVALAMGQRDAKDAAKGGAYWIDYTVPKCGGATIDFGTGPTGSGMPPAMYALWPRKSKQVFITQTQPGFSTLRIPIPESVHTRTVQRQPPGSRPLGERKRVARPQPGDVIAAEVGSRRSTEARYIIAVEKGETVSDSLIAYNTGPNTPQRRMTERSFRQWACRFQARLIGATTIPAQKIFPVVLK